MAGSGSTIGPTLDRAFESLKGQPVRRRINTIMVLAEDALVSARIPTVGGLFQAVLAARWENRCWVSD